MDAVKAGLSKKVRQEIEHFGVQVKRFKDKEIPEEKFKRYRLQNGIYGQRQPGHQMVRVKIPSGLLSAEKFRCLADIAEKYATGIGHVTTRQDIQFHYVELDQVQPLMTDLAAAGLTTREACGNTVRNVISCQRSGICPTELFDVSRIAEQVAYHLLWNPVNQDLPRKFKISFSGCTTECGLAAIHDLGFVAASREDAGKTILGFKVFIGGGLGSHPKLAKLYSEFLPIDEVLPLCEATLKLFDIHGNRRNKSKARMKFVLENWGIDKFKAELGKELKALKQAGRSFPPLHHPSLKTASPALPVLSNGNGLAGGPFQQWQRTNLLPQPDESVAVQIRLPLGDISAKQMRGLADIMDRFSTNGARTTHQQNIILHRVTQDQLSSLYDALQAIGLADAGAEQVVDVIACPGADTCQLALTSSMGVGAAITDAFSKDLSEYNDLEGLRVRISGCPNSCGHHHIAGIGLHGVAKKVNGTLVPHYQLHLGGGVDAHNPSLGKSKIKIPAKNIPQALLALIRLYRENQAGDESFNAFVERYGREAIGQKLSAFYDLPPAEEDPEAYFDWKGEGPFSLDDIGPGECSGTVIDMIEHGLRKARETFDQARQAAQNGNQGEVIPLVKTAILLDCRSLLYTYGIDSKHDDQILKEFQHKLVEQAILSERFEGFTRELGFWADFSEDPEALSALLGEVGAFVSECQAAYDRMDASMKLRKKAPDMAEKEEVAVAADKKADVFLDLSGVACPMNFVKTKLELEEMDEGQVLEVILDEGEPVKNVPRSVKAEGHKVLALNEVPDGHFSLVIEKVD